MGSQMCDVTVTYRDGRTAQLQNIYLRARPSPSRLTRPPWRAKSPSSPTPSPPSTRRPPPLVEKRELWSTISTIQSDITTSLARASYLEKEGFAVDPDNVGALVKMHYKLHSFVTYKLKKGKK